MPADHPLLRAIIGACVAAECLAGCGSLGLREDLVRVQSRAVLALPRRLEEPTAPVDPETEERVRQTLAAPMTAEDAVRVAISNNRSLRGALRDLGVFRGRLVQAGLPSNPALGFDVRHPNDPAQPLQMDLSLEWDLTHALLAPARASVAQAELEAARHRAAEAVIDLGFRVRAGVYALQAAQARLVIATRALDTFAAAREAADALHESGNILRLERFTHEASYESARITVAQLELDVLERREALQRLLGLLGEDTRWALRDSLPPVPETFSVEPDLERRALTASLTLAERRSALEALARRTGLTRAEGLIPDVSVDAHIEQDGTFWEVGGGATVRVPLFDRRQGALAATESAFDAAMERYLAAAVDLRSHARAARNRALSAHRRALHYANVILPARRRVLEQWMLQYNAMQIGVFALLQARRDELDAQLRSVETAREFWTARAALEALLAGRRVDMADGASSASIEAMDGAGARPHGGH
jgi:cobalt-zinc-cadmium efflux system outer membrane protein